MMGVEELLADLERMQVEEVQAPLTLQQLDFPTAEVFVPLLERGQRYLAAHGGRGSGKSHFFADLLVERHLSTPGLCSVCIREVQKTLEHSAKKLIETKIKEKGLEGNGPGQFIIQKDRILAPGKGLIIFQGMQDHTAESIKSLEGFDIAWWEEAQTASQRSLDLLIPTIRRPGSEIWFSWNPRFKHDPVDMMFRGDRMPSKTILVEANWSDNPWFPDVLEQERQDCLEINPDKYEHIWGGGYVQITEGAYYARQLQIAKRQNRVGVVAQDELLSFHAFVDIGGTGARSDAFTIWVCQFVGMQVRALKYYEAVGQEAKFHLAWLRENDFREKQTTIWLPHEGEQKDRVVDASYESFFTTAGYDVEVVPNQGKGAAMARIEAGRRVFPNVWFDESGCEGGLSALGWYHEKIDPIRKIGLGPEHDWASHGSDSFGLMAIVYLQEMHGNTQSVQQSNKPQGNYGNHGQGWMR